MAAKRVGYDGENETLLSRASINQLAANALFTVTLNGGTLMDNFQTQTPVLSVGMSLFAETDALLHDANVTRGMETMLRLAPHWDEERRRRQRQIVCWYEAHSLNVAKSARENLLVLQSHLSRVSPSLVL